VKHGVCMECPCLFPFVCIGFFFEGVSFYLKIVTKSLKKHGNEEN
jgi:hypothetical protein